MATTRQTMGALMAPGLNIVETRLETPSFFEEFYNMDTTNRAFETQQELVGFGLAKYKPEQVEAAYDDPSMGWNKTFPTIRYGLKYRLSWEAREFELYNRLTSRMVDGFVTSVQATKETLAAAIVGNGFNIDPAGGNPDGVPLFSANHPFPNGLGFYANAPSISSALSAQSIQNGINTIRATPDDRGILQTYRAFTLVVPRALQFSAQNLIRSAQVVGSNFNDINTIQDALTVKVWDYLDAYSTTAWYLFCEKEKVGLKWFDHQRYRTRNYVDQSTEDWVAECTFSMAYGESFARGSYGAAGI